VTALGLRPLAIGAGWGGDRIAREFASELAAGFRRMRPFDFPPELKSGTLYLRTIEVMDGCCRHRDRSRVLWRQSVKAAHHVEEWMIEPVLVQTLAHVLVLANEQQREMERLAVALAWRGRL
jgi:hypothetical protein